MLSVASDRSLMWAFSHRSLWHHNDLLDHSEATSKELWKKEKGGFQVLLGLCSFSNLSPWRYLQEWTEPTVQENTGPQRVQCRAAIPPLHQWRSSFAVCPLCLSTPSSHQTLIQVWARKGDFTSNLFPVSNYCVTSVKQIAISKREAYFPHTKKHKHRQCRGDWLDVGIRGQCSFSH